MTIPTLATRSAKQMLGKVSLAARTLTFFLVLAVGCDVLAPSTNPEGLIWEVAGELSTQPLATESLVIAAFVDGSVKAFDRQRGTLVWQRHLLVEMRADRLVRFRDLVVVPAVELVALDIRTGVERWRFSGAERQAGALPPQLAGDTLFVPGYVGGEASAINANTGVPYWRVQLGGGVTEPAVGSELVVFPTRDLAMGGTTSLVALKRTTGLERWRRAMPSDVRSPGGVPTAGVIVGGNLVVGTLLGGVHAYRLGTGEPVWEAGAGIDAAGYGNRPLHVGENILFLRSDAVLEAYRATDGTLVRTDRSNAGVSSVELQLCPPYLCRANGRVWVLDTSGRTVWAYGGGTSGVVFLSNVEVDDDNVMYAGIVRGQNRSSLIAFRVSPQHSGSRGGAARTSRLRA